MSTALAQLGVTRDSPAEPKYEQVKRYLLSELAAGRLSAGESLPTEVRFAEQLAISRTTVRQAFADLEQAGVLRRVRGKGTFINEAVSGRTGQAERAVSLSTLYGLIIPELEHGFYPALQRSFSEAAGRLHRQVIVGNSDQDVYRQADILLQFADRKVGGIAMVPISHPDRGTPTHHVRPLRDMGIPVVFCHRGVEGIRAPLIAFSGLDVGRVAGRALVDHGHRRVAFFGTHRGPMSEFYLRGLREQLGAAGLGLSDRFVHFGSRLGHTIPAEHDAGVRRKLDELFASADKPTAIFSSFDPEAELIFLLLTQMGVRVPDDVSLVGVGGSTRVGAFAQRLTSVTVNEDEIGRRAFEVLNQINSRQRPLDDAEVSLVPLALSDGRTLSRGS